MQAKGMEPPAIALIRPAIVVNMAPVKLGINGEWMTGACSGVSIMPSAVPVADSFPVECRLWPHRPPGERAGCSPVAEVGSRWQSTSAGIDLVDSRRPKSATEAGRLRRSGGQLPSL